MASEAPCSWLAADVMTILKTKMYTEIQDWYFKWLLSKYVDLLENLKCISWFNMTSTIIMCGFNQIYILTQIYNKMLKTEAMCS